MNSTFRHLFGYNGYPLSAVAAVALHCLVLGFILYWNTASDSSEFELVQPTVIKSLFIDENPQLRERRRLERQQIQRQRDEEQLRQQEQEQQLQREEEQQRRREQEEERQRQAEEERQHRQLLEQQRQQELRDQAERERLQEEERRRREELADQEQQRQREEAELARLMEEAATAAARTEFEVVQSGVALIQEIVEKAWNRPPSARNGMRAVLRISMLPTGEVTDVAITQSSGDAPFDRAATNAVYSAQPFSELRQMPINIFNDNFRTLTLIFQPEDLLN